jgi:hypothetical protein
VHRLAQPGRRLCHSASPTRCCATRSRRRDARLQAVAGRKAYRAATNMASLPCMWGKRTGSLSFGMHRTDRARLGCPAHPTLWCLRRRAADNATTSRMQPIYDPGRVRVPGAIVRAEWDSVIRDADARWLFDGLHASPMRCATRYIAKQQRSDWGAIGRSARRERGRGGRYVCRGV